MSLLALFLFAAIMSAQDFGAAARELARRIGEGVVVTVRNNSSLDPAKVEEVRKALERRVGREGAAEVTLSENWRGYVWVADIRRGEERSVAIVSVDRPAAPAPAARSRRITLDKQLLWEQDQPILDVARSGNILLVLEPGKVSLYEGRELRRAVAVSVARPYPRDVRGRLVVEGDQFRAWLPGAGNEPWPIPGGPASLAEGRNYFTRGGLPPFYSGAEIGSIWIQAGVDGRVQMFDKAERPLGAINGWGSDIVGACGDAVLVTRPGDDREADWVQPWILADGRATAAGDPIEFAGSITALWPLDAGAALAVARNPKTEKYAAYRLAVGCGH